MLGLKSKECVCTTTPRLDHLVPYVCTMVVELFQVNPLSRLRQAQFICVDAHHRERLLFLFVHDHDHGRAHGRAHAHILC